MAAKRQEDLLARIPTLLRKCAIDLSSEGSGEYAYPISKAEEVFDALIGSGVVILGGDLWKIVSDGFASCHVGWYSKQNDGGDASDRWHEFAMRIPNEDAYYVTFVG